MTEEPYDYAKAAQGGRRCPRRPPTRTTPTRAGPLQHHFADLEQQKEAAHLGMWVFIAQEVLFFGGLFATYVVYRGMYPEAFADGSHHLSWKLGSAQHGRPDRLEPHDGHGRPLRGGREEPADRRLPPGHDPPRVGLPRGEGRRVRQKFARLGDGSPGASCRERFDPAAVHLAGDEGRHAQIFLALLRDDRAPRPPHDHRHPDHPGLRLHGLARAVQPEYHTPVELVGLYWHFVDIVWIFLFPLLYLIGAH